MTFKHHNFQMPSTVTDYTGQCQTLLPVKDTNLKSYATSKSDTNNPIRLGAGTWQACWAAGRAGCRPGWLLAVWEHRRCSSWVLSVSYILPVDPVYNIININYASSRHGRRGACLHVYHAICGLWEMHWVCGFWHTGFPSHRVAYTQAICSRRSGLAALSLSDTVLGRRVSLHVWSRTQITLAMWGWMVLISINAVLRLLKRSMCVRGRTHLVVCRYLPVWRRAKCGSWILILGLTHNSMQAHYLFHTETFYDSRTHRYTERTRIIQVL